MIYIILHIADNSILSFFTFTFYFSDSEDDIHKPLEFEDEDDDEADDRLVSSIQQLTSNSVNEVKKRKLDAKLTRMLF